MSALLTFLFPAPRYTARASWFLLALRLLFGALLLSHGIAKWIGFRELSASFPDPLGAGARTSLVLALLAEVVCAVAFMMGAFYRVALIPMILAMGMAFFVVHGGDPFAARELAFVYLAMFILLFVSGPGNFSVDRFIGKRLARRRDRGRYGGRPDGSLDRGMTRRMRE